MLVASMETGLYKVIEGSTINPLQHIERTTAEVLLEALHRRTCVSSAAEDFDDRLRVTAQDGASSNDRTERTEAFQRGQLWRQIALYCEDLSLQEHPQTSANLE